MPRVPRTWGLPVLGRRASVPKHTTPLAIRASSSSSSSSSTSRTQILRRKLWKDGEAPGPEDPYTQRMEPAEEEQGYGEEGYTPSSRTLSGRDRTPRAVRETRLAMPARRTEAATESEVESSDPSYTPATSLEDLAEVGPLRTWWDQPGHWGPESIFRGFGRAAAARVVDRNLVEVHLRRAVVEVLALRETGRLAEWATRRWADDGSRAALDAALRADISVAADGTASLSGGQASAIADGLTADAEGASPAASEVVDEIISLDEAREMVKSWDSSWKDVMLDTEAKFAIRKRLYQLTGTLIPDARLGAARTARHLVTVASKQPRQPKLAELLEEQRPDFVSLPNVRVHESKIGPIDREVEVGRWKVIEEELKKRGLPVTGIDGLAGHKEKKWVRGEE